MAQEPSLNVVSVLIFIGAIMGLFLACALVFMRRGNRRANLLLAALLLAFSVVMIDGFMHVSNYYSRYPYLLGLLWPAKFLLGPFLYFYVRELSSPRKTVFSWTQLLHFLPMAVSFFPQRPLLVLSILASLRLRSGFQKVLVAWRLPR